MSRSLDTHISRLRTLLDLRPANGFIVTAVYGVGYRFEAVQGQHKGWRSAATESGGHCPLKET